jgi:hypothetical protein
LGRIFGMLLLALAACSAGAACAPRHTLNFPDGTKGCLTDYPLAERRVSYMLSSVSQLVHANGIYYVALPRQPAMCPRAMGFLAASPTGAINVLGHLRFAKVLEGCRAEAGNEQTARGQPCECVVAISEGNVQVRRADFERMARDVEAPQSVALAGRPAASAPASPPPRVAEAPPRTAETPAAAASKPAAAVAAPAPAPGPTAAELAALRQQLEALQAQVGRQQAAALPKPAAAAAQRLKARALVIGNGAYASLGTLPNPRRDAQAIAAKLRGFGIDVDVALDADRIGLVKALSDYQNRAAAYDVNILFYAGHGLQVGGTNYIVPVDLSAAGATVGSIKLNAVSLNDALEYLPARTRVVFLDACRDNPLARSLLATRGGGSGLAPVSTTSGTLVAYATKDGSTAEDGNGRNSPYTTALLQHLDAEEDIAVVLRRVRQSVLKATANRQEPWEYGSLIGDQLVLSRLAR